MNTILGNNFLISIAFTANSPTQAAKTAQMMGYSREQVRVVRNAAALKRDQGLEAFNKEFQPFEIVSVEPKQCRTMTMKLFLNKTYEVRPLNVTEFNEVAEHITRELTKLGIEVKIDKKDSNPYAKSAIFPK
jgi:hypothetical protein